MNHIIWIAAMEILSPAVMVGLVLTVYIVHRKHQNRMDKSKRSHE
jgi:hypothetical protein